MKITINVSDETGSILKDMKKKLGLNIGDVVEKLVNYEMEIFAMNLRVYARGFARGLSKCGAYEKVVEFERTYGKWSKANKIERFKQYFNVDYEFEFCCGFYDGILDGLAK